jgi:hypothetical protein
MTTTTHTLTAAGAGPVDVTVDERGQWHPFLLLHGGAGPQSVAGFAELRSYCRPSRTMSAPAPPPPTTQAADPSTRPATSAERATFGRRALLGRPAQPPWRLRGSP